MSSESLVLYRHCLLCFQMNQRESMLPGACYLRALILKGPTFTIQSQRSLNPFVGLGVGIKILGKPSFTHSQTQQKKKKCDKFLMFLIHHRIPNFSRSFPQKNKKIAKKKKKGFYNTMLLKTCMCS